MLVVGLPSTDLLKAQVMPPVKQWDKTYGGSLNDIPYSLVATSDGGYLLGGSSQSGLTGDKSEDSRGDLDYWVVKLDAKGSKQWDKTLGGGSVDWLTSIVATPDGGYLLGGWSDSGISGEKSDTSRGGDYWVVKIDSRGNKQWDKTYGGSSYDALYTMTPTSDGGYLLGGYSDSGISGEKSEDRRGADAYARDYWIVNIDGVGNKLWDKTFGGSEWDHVTAMVTTSNGGYLLGGVSGNDNLEEGGISGYDNTGDKTQESRGGNDYWVVKIDGKGNKEWDKTLGGNYRDELRSLVATSDGGYLLGGLSYSDISGEKTEAPRGSTDYSDYWLVKIDSTGNKLWDKIYGGDKWDELSSLVATSDGGYLLGGWSNSDISGEKSDTSRGGPDYWLVKLGPEQVRSTQYRINAGGGKHRTVYNQQYQGDAYYSGGVVSTRVTTPVAGTGDDYLYQTGRHGDSFSYDLPIQNGDYDVVLHFCETYWGNLAPGGVGSRRFKVDIEGVRKLTEYDIFQKAGGAMRVKQETFRVSVIDGTLNIAFLKGSSDLASIKAIEVLPAGSFYRINAGGETVATSSNQTFTSDTYYADGKTYQVTTPIDNTLEDSLYQTERYGPAFSYGLPTGNGTFDVTLHFSELYWGVKVKGGVGSRRFNVDIEGERKLIEYDIFQKAGGALKATQESFRVTVTDGVLNLLFTKGSKDLAQVSAIELLPVTSNMTAARIASGKSTAEILLYPNPVQDKLTVQLPFPVRQLQATTITDPKGGSCLVNAHKVIGGNQLEFRVEKLPKGMYLLELEAQQESKIIKFVKQ